MKLLSKWALNLLVTLGVTVICVYLVWNLTPIKKELRDDVVEKLRPYVGESFLLKSVSVGFGHVALQAVTLSEKRQHYALQIEEIRIGYNLLNLFSPGLNPRNVIRSVVFLNPRLTLFAPDSLTSASPPRDSLNVDSIAQNFLAGLQKFPHVDKISISGGQLTWVKPSGKRVNLFSKLNGFLVNDEQGRAQVIVEGEFLGFHSSQITLQASLDYLRNNWEGALLFQDCKLTSSLPLTVNGHYKLDRATLNGEVRFRNSSFLLDSLKLNGRVRVSDFSGYVFDQHASAEEFWITLRDQQLIVEKFNGDIEGGQAMFSGEVSGLLRPVVRLALDVKDYPASCLKKSHSIFEPVLQGKIRGSFEISGPLDKIKITGHAFSPAIQFAVIPFTNVYTELVYQDKLLRFPKARADFKKFISRASGTVNFETSKLRFTVDSDLDIPQQTFYIWDKLNRARFVLKTLFSGNFQEKNFTGQFLYRFTREDTLLVDGLGPFQLNDQYLTFDLKSVNLSDTLKARGAIAALFSNPTFRILDLKNLPVDKFTSNPIIKSLTPDYQVNSYLAGPYNFLKGKINIIYRENERLAFTLWGSIKNIFNEGQWFKGRFQAHTYPLQLEGTYELSYDDQGITAKINSPDLIQGELFSGYSQDAPFRGELTVQKFAVEDYLSPASEKGNAPLQGNVQGKIFFSGTVGKPDVRFNLSASEFIINNVGYYSTRLQGKLQNHALEFDTCLVRLNEVPVFNASVSWNVLSDELRLDISGRNIESNFLAETIFEDKNIIKGSFSYDLHAYGPLEHPRVYGDVQIRDGVFSENPFDLISLSFEDSLLAGSKFYEIGKHLVKVRKFLYVNKKEYTIEGDGLLSVDEDGPLDIRLTVTGNILAELPKIESYFRNPNSNGKCQARIVGSRTTPQFKEFSLQIASGSLAFESVLPEVTNLSAAIELEPETNFVHIKYLKGLLNNRTAMIYNLPSAKVGDRELQPWRFEGIDLNFGVLVLETDPRGIPLSVPGLMQEGDVGYFAAEGRTAQEKFYFAGPVEQPYCRGKVIVNNARVTFPFIGMEEESEEPGRVVEFLMNVNWDVFARSGSGTRYFVDIPAYVGKVYMDLDIDDTSEGLLFTGRLIDDSFRVEGSAESSRGRVEYLDINFRVEKFGAVFNRFEIYPEVYGKAYTTVRDSTGNFPRDIYLVLYAIDPETKEEISKGRWEDFRFKLVSSDPTIGETQEQVLAYLGYSLKNLQQKAGTVGMTMTENLLFRPLVRPLERKLERDLRLDYVRLRSNFTQNLFYYSLLNRYKFFDNPISLNPGVNNNLNPALLLLQSSEITLGKYLYRNIYFTYSGQLVSVYDEARLGLNHKFGLEYRLLRNLLLEVEYDKFQYSPLYYNREILTDFRIRFRHSIIFDLHDLF